MVKAKETTNLVVQDEGLTYSQEQINLIKNTVAIGATDNELQMFLYLAKQYNLDPFKKEIWFVKYKDRTSIVTSRDGYLKFAQDNPEFEGLISFIVKEGDIFEIDSANYVVNHKFGAKRGRILGAWAKCDRKGKKPFMTYVEFAEYNQNNSIWNKYPSAMIQKVAEVFVLKRAFGISGLVTQEEMSMSEEAPPKQPEKDYPPKNNPPKDNKKGKAPEAPDNVTNIDEHKMLKEQKDAITDVATAKGLVIWNENKTAANTNPLKMYCMKELNITLGSLDYDSANLLLQKLAEYEVPKLEAEMVEVDGIEMTEEEKRIIEEFSNAK